MAQGWPTSIRQVEALEDVRAVLARVDVLKALANELEQGVELKLSVAFDTLFPAHLAAEALAALYRRYPGVAVRVGHTSLGGTVDALRTTRCAVAVVVLDEIDDDIARRFLMRLSTVAVVAAEHPLAKLVRKRGVDLERAISEQIQIVIEDPSAITSGR